MIYDKTGHRKYLTIRERDAFITAARRVSPEAETFCLTLAYTGARISEVLALTSERFDTEVGMVMIESLKKRRQGVYRAIPVPRLLLERLESIHELSITQLDPASRTKRLWPWGRTKAWGLVKRTMRSTDIAPSRAMPKALRHAFGVSAAQANIPLNMVQRWMGHARIETTAIYTNAIGEEELELARRMWRLAKF